MNIQRKIVVRGKVQGVGFRNATWRKAMELGIRGSVRNLDDGSVEILASATDKEFKVFENWCRVGPSHARVDRFEISELDQTGFTDFSIDD